MIFRRADAQFVIAAAGDHGIEHAFDVGKLDRTVGDPALPVTTSSIGSSQCIPRDPLRTISICELALDRRRSNRGRDLVGAASYRGGIARNVNAKRAHRSASASKVSSFLASSRATIRPSIMADGDTEQRPRQ